MVLNIISSLSIRFNLVVSYWILIVGFTFFIFSLTYKVKQLEKLDMQGFSYFNNQNQIITRIYRYLWPLGTTPVAAMVVMMMYLSSFRSGLISSIIFILLLVLERSIKLSLKRKRPFESSLDSKPLQPIVPADPSFPSGDAMRIMFLALSIPIIFNLPTYSIGILFVLAMSLSFGRIVLGVHYPFDVLGGVGLGMIGSAFTSFVLESSILL